MPWIDCASEALIYHCPKPQTGGKQAGLVLTPLELIDRIAALVPPPIARIYEVFPLVCSICAGQTRLIAFITDGAGIPKGWIRPRFLVADYASLMSHPKSAGFHTGSGGDTWPDAVEFPIRIRCNRQGNANSSELGAGTPA